MSSATQLTGMIFFETTFLSILLLFGLTVPTIGSDIQNTMNQVTSPFPQFSPPSVSSSQVGFPGCLLFLPSCFGSTVTDNLGIVAYDIGYIAIVAFTFIYRLLLFSSIFTILLAIPTSLVPGQIGQFIASFIVGIQISIFVAFIIILRGSSTGG